MPVEAGSGTMEGGGINGAPLGSGGAAGRSGEAGVAFRLTGEAAGLGGQGREGGWLARGDAHGGEGRSSWRELGDAIEGAGAARPTAGDAGRSTGSEGRAEAPAQEGRAEAPGQGPDYYDRVASDLIADAGRTMEARERQMLDGADAAARAQAARPEPPQAPEARQETGLERYGLADAAAVRDMHAKLEPYFDRADKLERAFAKDPALFGALRDMKQEAASEKLESMLGKPTDPKEAGAPERSLREMREDVGYFATARERADYYAMVRHELKFGGPSNWDHLNKLRPEEADAVLAANRERFMERGERSVAQRVRDGAADWLRDMPAQAREDEDYLNSEAGQRLGWFATGRAWDTRRWRD